MTLENSKFIEKFCETNFPSRIVVISTGLVPNVPKHLNNIDGYENVSLNTSEYEGKSVLILGIISLVSFNLKKVFKFHLKGRGNAAFEIAQSIYGATNFIHMVSRSRIRLEINLLFY